MKPCMFQKLLALISLLRIVSWVPLGKAAGQCNSGGSDYGKALTGHTFKKFKVNRPSDCVIRCENEPGCQSYNYKLEEKICELNSRSKETRPMNYITDLTRIYMTVKFIEDKDESSSSPWNISDGLLSYWRLNGTDSQVKLKGSARYEEQDGRTALYTDGSSGAFAETPSLPIHRTNLTIAAWIKMKNSGAKEYTVYGDWSKPWSFRLFINRSSHFCAQARNEYDIDLLGMCTRDAVRVNKWSHVAMTWGRTEGTLRLFINGEMNTSKNVTSNSMDIKNSSHSVYDIGLKRDDGETTHAYYSDLMVFSRELRFSSIENVNQIKEHLVLNHPLYAYI